MADHTPMQLDKYYNLLYRKEIAYTSQPLFCKAGYRPVRVQCMNSIQNSMYNIDDGSGGSDVGMLHQALTGILTEQKFISDCIYRVIKSSFHISVLFREVFSNPYISFFHLL